MFAQSSRWQWWKLVVVGLWCCWVCLWPSPAVAAIRQLEERPGQIVYQARQRLTDQDGNYWQAIAYQRTYPDRAPILHLRLVTTPGAVTLAHPHPLQFQNSLGVTLAAPDVSAGVSTETTTPANIGEYDLGEILPQLQPAIPLQLSLITVEGQVIRLPIPPMVVQEWQQVQTQ